MLTINIPFKTPTIYKMYGYRGYMRYITKEGRMLRERIIERTKGLLKHADMTEYEGKELSIIVEIHEDWYCKNGSIKRVDISNREKFLIDSVFMGIGLDDKQLFDHRMVKVQDDEEYADVMIEVLQ